MKDGQLKEVEKVNEAIGSFQYPCPEGRGHSVILRG